MNRVSRFLIIGFIGFLYTLLFNCSSVFADDTCIIKSADYHMHLLSNGNATVTETWYVEYVGESKSFSNDILIDTSKGKEKYYNAIDFTVRLDGVYCKQVGSLADSEEYTFLVDSVPNGNESAMAYTVFFDKKDTSAIFEITYTLMNVVKFVDNEYFFFEYDIFADDYPYKIDSFSYSVDSFDDEANIWIVDTTRGVSTDGQNFASVATKDLTGKYEVQVKIDDVYFNVLNSSKISSESLIRKKRGITTEEKVIIVMSCIAAFFLLGFLILKFGKSFSIWFVLEFDKICIDANTNKGYEKVCQIVKKWVPLYFTPLVFALKVSDNCFLSFFTLMVDLERRKLLHFLDGDSGVSIVFNKEESLYKLDSDKIVYRVLMDIQKSLEEWGNALKVTEGYGGFNIRRFLTYFKNYENSKRVLGELHDYVMSNTPMNINDKKVYFDALYLRAYFNIVNSKSLDFTDLFKVLKSYNVTEETLLYLRFAVRTIESMQKELKKREKVGYRHLLDYEVLAIILSVTETLQDELKRNAEKVGYNFDVIF